MSSKNASPPMSLAEFVNARKRADCSVCKLPDDVKTQLREAGNKKKIRRPEMLEWLRAVVGVNVTDADLNAHYSGRHEAA